MNIAAIITTLAIIIMGFAGGGGSSSGGGSSGGSSSSSSSHSSSSSSYSTSSSSGGTDDPLGFFIGLGIFTVIVLITIAVGNKTTPRPRDHNSTPAEKQLHAEAKRIFETYQSDWTNFNYENLKNYTTSHYEAHATLMLDLLKDLHRVNRVGHVRVNHVYLQDPVPADATFPLKLRITYVFDGLDQVIDTQTDKKLYEYYAKNVSETWNYIYDGTALRLDGISQPTESAPHLVKSLADFASAHHLYYSPDWGRYCLPARGLIFGGASMSIADINNHVIGKWGDLLIQLYTYAPTPGQATSSYYIVGQINVPKNYLGVIVKSKQFSSGDKPDKSYEKFEMEWNDFNDRYEVYAASRDALPAFELLNPKFMEFLYSKNPSYGLEVVDNVIYIYANITTVTEKDYADLLEVLQKAYDELKM